MSGSENLRGIDYQVACSLLLVLDALSEHDSGLVSVQIDSLNNDEEDLTLRFRTDPTRHIQLKKRAEGYNWTASSLRPVLAKFSQQDAKAECVFISDGSLSPQLRSLVRFLQEGEDLSDKVYQAVCVDGFSKAELDFLRGRVSIRTRFFPSPDETDPSRLVMAEIRGKLLRGPFSFNGEAEQISRRLWQELYAGGRNGTELTRDDLLQRFTTAGLRLSKREWASYPTIDRFYTHTESIESIVHTLVDGGVAIIYGISGAGKTTLSAEAAAAALQLERTSCWIRVTEFLEPADFIRSFAEYCIGVGLPHLAEMLRSSEPADFARVVCEILKKHHVAIVIDGFEAANAGFGSLVRNTLETLPRTRTGGVLVTCQSLPGWWADLQRENSAVRSVPLAGLPDESAVAILTDLEICENDLQRRQLSNEVGGHAQSLALFRQVRSQPQIEDSHRKGVEIARDWLLRRILDELPEREKIGIARLSIFAYAPDVDLAHVVLDEMGPDTLRSLQKRDLVRINMGTLTVHDSIRNAAIGILSKQAVEQCNRKVADAVGAEIVRDLEDGDGFTYEKIIRWSDHLESAGDFRDLGGRFHLILNRTPEDLRALFAISMHGFPYEFDDPSLDRTCEVVDRLIAEGLVEENPVPDHQDDHDGPILRLVGFEQLEQLLIAGLCLHHGYAGHLGYFNVMRPNFAFAQQGLVCPWEHCIELCDLPPMPKAEWEECLESDRQRLASPDAARLTEAQVAFIKARIAEGVPDGAPEQADEELEAKSCPIFGHACPGGATQARICRQNENGDSFEWATAQ
ncbi:MAG: AAA-like domain protein [Phycisphaerales bacterium]|nr:AAA-like domain protein [Phycisphaerales bacterium]